MTYCFIQPAFMTTLHPFVAETLKHLRISPEDAARAFAMVQIQDKIRDYETEMRAFEAKYRMSFEDFSVYMEARKNEEIFEESDDWNDWRSSIELSLRYKQHFEQLASLSSFSEPEVA
jgi:hypothetical protein